VRKPSKILAKLKVKSGCKRGFGSLGGGGAQWGRRWSNAVDRPDYKQDWVKVIRVQFSSDENRLLKRRRRQSSLGIGDLRASSAMRGAAIRSFSFGHYNMQEKAPYAPQPGGAGKWEGLLDWCPEQTCRWAAGSLMVGGKQALLVDEESANKDGGRRATLDRRQGKVEDKWRGGNFHN